MNEETIQRRAFDMNKPLFYVSQEHLLMLRNVLWKVSKEPWMSLASQVNLMHFYDEVMHELRLTK